MSRKHQPSCEVNAVCGVPGKWRPIRRNAAQYWYWNNKFMAVPRTLYGVDISQPPNSSAILCCGACRESILNES